MTAADFRLLVA